MANDQRTCFVIIPNCDTSPHRDRAYWDRHFDQFLRPIIEEVPLLVPKRSATDEGDTSAVADIVTTDVVIADITDGDPRVYWELAVRQSFKLGTVIIAAHGTTIPFEVSSQPILLYNTDSHLGLADFRKALMKRLTAALDNPSAGDSKIWEQLGSRGTLHDIMNRGSLIRRLDGLLAEVRRNERLLEKVFEQANANQIVPAERKCVSERLRTPAIETLLVERYLDESKNFYVLTDKYFGRVLEINHQLDSWLRQSDSTERWLLKVKKDTLGGIEELKTTVRKLRSKHKSRY